MPRSRGLSATRRQTLYLLPDIDPTPDGLRSALYDDGIREQGYQLATPTSLSVPSLFAYGSAPSDADWCADARITTGLPVSFTDQRSGAVHACAYSPRTAGASPSHRRGHRHQRRCPVKGLFPKPVHPLRVGFELQNVTSVPSCNCPSGSQAAHIEPTARGAISGSDDCE